MFSVSQWPDEELIPGFRETLQIYLEEVESLSYEVSSLLTEALGLGPNGLSHFYETKELMQHRGKIVKYPVVTGGSDQGVGPHYDAGFFTFVRGDELVLYLYLSNMVASFYKLLPMKDYRCRTCQEIGLMHRLYQELSSSTLERVGSSLFFMSIQSYGPQRSSLSLVASHELHLIEFYHPKATHHDILYLFSRTYHCGLSLLTRY
jgi:isopenicillin N synthase-like dioxygenase